MTTVSAELAALAADPLFESGLGDLDGRTVVVAAGGGLIARWVTAGLAALARQHGQRLRLVILVRSMEAAQQWYSAHLVGVDHELRQQTLGQPWDYDGEAGLILHAGGGSSPVEYRRDPVGVASANVRAAFDVLELARQRDSRVAYLSSREVYGHARGTGQPLAETVPGEFDHLAVRNVYPESKRMTESLLVAYHEQYRIDYQILRLASVYGPGMKLIDDGRAMSDLVSARLSGSDVILNSDGRARRAYCYVLDAARGVLAAMLSGAWPGVYNLANEREPVSIRDLAARIAQLPVPGLPEVTVTTGRPAPPGSYSDFDYLGLDTAALESLGWTPWVGLDDGLRRTLAAFLEDPNAAG